MPSLFPTIGAAVALAGGDKLSGSPGYQAMFRHLGWTPRTMQAVAAAELAGGLLMLPRATRRLGGAVVAATSAAVLMSEMQHQDAKLATPRAMVLLAGLAAIVRPGARHSR